MMIALIGLNANAAMYIVGSDPFGNWDPAAGVEMTLLEDGATYSYDFTMPGTAQNEASIWFVFSTGIGTWEAINAGRYDSGNASADMIVTANQEFTPVQGNTNKSFAFTGTAGEMYTITFNPTTMTAKVAGYVAPIVTEIWTVAGTPAAVFGPTWSTTETSNDMTLDEADGLYKLAKNGIELANGTTIEFKVARNHAWGTAYPSSNYTYNITESGTYNLLFTFNATTHEVGFTATKMSDGPDVNPLTGELYMMGQVNGNGWAGNVGAAMATEDGNIFTLTDAVIADAGEGYGFFSFTSKLGENADDWSFNDYRRGAIEDGTIVNDGVLAELAEWGISNAFKALAGTYDVVVDLSQGTVMLTKKADVVPETDKVYIIGDVNNIGWNATEGVEMTYDETNKVYTAEITTENQGDLGIAYFGFTKKLADAESATPWDDIAAYRFGPVSEDAFVMTKELLGTNCKLATDGSYNSIAIPAGTWTVTVDLVNNTFAIAGEWPVDTVVPEPYTGNLYILGEVNGNSWAPNTGVQMTYDAEKAVFTAEVTAEAENFDEELGANYSYFSFTKLLAETADDWAAIAGSRMGAVAEGNFLVTDEYLGKNLSIVNGEVAFKVPSGNTYDITVSVDEMYVIINKVEPTQWELGDVNHDHSVDVADVTTLISFILGNDPVDFYTSEANVDGDAENSYDVGDVTALIAKILGN